LCWPVIIKKKPSHYKQENDKLRNNQEMLKIYSQKSQICWNHQFTEMIMEY